MTETASYVDHYVDGTWTPGNGGEFASINPYSGEAWAVLSSADESDVDRTVQAARRAFPVWRDTPGLERSRVLHRIAELIEDHLDELGEIETRDNGKLFKENRNQIQFAARNYRFHAGLADKMNGETKPLDRADVLNFTMREPLGAVVLITASNSPLQTLSNKLAPALAAGNSVVIKPSEHASVSTLVFAGLLEDAGVPAGVVNVVTGEAETGRALTSHPDIAKISFTGGVATAKRIAANAAANLVPATFELGGKSPNIVFDDANLDRAIPGAISGIFAAAGQTCVAGSRLLLQRGIHDQVVDAIAERAKAIRLGDPMDPDTQMGPIAHADQYAHITSLVEGARSDGATLVAGGAPVDDIAGGMFFQPTIFTDVDPESTLAQTEAFGPVLAVIPFDDEDEAVAIANGTTYGLAAGLWSQDINRALRVARQLEAGMVWVNTYRASAAQAPFGGVKLSGYGRERGTEGLLEYTRIRNTMVDLSEAVRDPFLLGT